MALTELIAALRAHWIRFVVCVAAGLAVGVASALVLPRWYRAVIVVVPAADVAGGVGGLSGLASRFGGLASIAGIDLGAVGANRSAITLETLRGQTFLSDFARRRGLVAPLFAGERFDSSQGKWHFDPAVFDERSGRWVGRGFGGANGEPSDSEVYRALSRQIYVDEDRRNGLFRITVESRFPAIAASWARLLVDDLNEYLRTKDSDEARRTIVYLERQIAATQVADMRAIFYRLIEEQTKTLMLAQVKQEYALKVIDAPVVPERPAWPNRVLLVALGALAGFLVALASILLRSRDERTSR